MELLVLSACGVVANQYMRLRTRSDDLHQYERDQQQVPPQRPPEPLGAKKTPDPVDDNAAQPQPQGFDDARYNEQFSHPQDPNPNVASKPWMRMVNAPYRPKEETEAEIPGPQDVFGHHMKSRVKQMETDFAKSTVPVTSEKQFDRPVEQISTGNGSAIGFHIGAATRYHKFIFNDQPTIESDGGPRGAFSGASGSHVPGDYRTVTQRSSLNHESVGPPMAVGVPQSSAPVPSFEITPSHLETYRMDHHFSNGAARASVQASASTDTSSFRNAHDENVNVLNTSLSTGAERFSTGASGYRDAKIHVPLNNDPLETYNHRVVPNAKVTKASDYQEQCITARQMMIPEMSQNVAALRKDRKPPVHGTTANKNGSLTLDTNGVKSGTATRGSSCLPVVTDTDAFCAPSDRKVIVAEKASLVSSGASAACAVGSSNSAQTPLFRTTKSMSENVGTPFIRGSGSKRASNLEPIHEETDTHLSEIEGSAIRKGLNRVATSVKAHTPASSSSSKNDRSTIFKKSERDSLLVKPGPTGTYRVGAANVDADGIVSYKDDDVVNVVRVGPMNNRNKKSRNEMDSTKDPKLGSVLNARIGSSPAIKRLLKNPYALPAASRISGV